MREKKIYLKKEEIDKKVIAFKLKIFIIFQLLVMLVLLFFENYSFWLLNIIVLKNNVFVPLKEIFEDEIYKSEASYISENNIYVKYFELYMPLTEEDYYYGKYENMVAAVNEFSSKIDYLVPDDYVGMHDTNIISMDPKYGYMQSDMYGWGSGACWFVSVLGGLIDKANVYWLENESYKLFDVVESWGHDYESSTYKDINNGRGYNIRYFKDGSIRDYRFYVRGKGDIKKVWFTFEIRKDDPNGYKGWSLYGRLTVILK